MIGVFLYIHNAYNMTWRHGVLMKPYAHNFRGNFRCFVCNFLQDRTFSVKLPGNVIMDVFIQENEVPQGSVPSPLLVCFMINDILSTAPVPRNLKYCTLTTVRYGTPCLTLSSQRGGFKTLLIPFSIWPLCGDLSFPLLSVSVLFLLDVPYLICN